MAKKVKDFMGETFTHPLYGDYTVIGDSGFIYKMPDGRKARKLKIQFKNTGYVTEQFQSSVTQKQIKDPYYKSVFGIGYFGEPIGYSYKNPVHKRIYNIWYGVMNRLYNENTPAFEKHGAKGVSIDPRWHNFANFFEDFQKLPGYQEWLNTPGYELDKDGLQSNIPINQRIYSKDTCQLIPGSVNAIIKHMDAVQSNQIPYVGVTYGGKNIYKSTFKSSYNGINEYILYSKFSNPLSAAIYHDVYCQVYNNMHPNNVPIDPISVYNAQQDRLDKTYTPLYHLITKEENK